MKKYQQKLGKFGERIALKFLQDKGYDVIDKNKYYRTGEIDIIAKKGRKIVFFEVKTRTNYNFGYPENALDKKKLAKISQSIIKFLNEHPGITEWETDCLSINYDFSHKLAKIYHIKNLDFSDL